MSEPYTLSEGDSARLTHAMRTAWCSELPDASKEHQAKLFRTFVAAEVEAIISAALAEQRGRVEGVCDDLDLVAENRRRIYFDDPGAHMLTTGTKAVRAALRGDG